MPNYIQYSTQIPSGSLKKGNAALGITNEVTGPTSTTGWYSGINPQSGSYVVYEVAASGDPDIYCPLNNTELLNLVKSKGATGGNTGSVAAALAWIATQDNLLAVNEIYPNIVTSGSVLMLDAGLVSSYPTTASTWYNISGVNKNLTLYNSPIFNPIGGITFDGVDDYAFNGDIKYSPFTYNVTFKGTSGYISRLQGYGWGVFISSNNVVAVWVDTDTSHRSTTTYISYTNSLVTNISVVFTGSAFSLYKNGTFLQTVSTPSSSVYSSTTSFYIGSDNGISGPFNGTVYSAQMYNRALSQVEILQNYYQAPIVTNGLVMALDAGNLVSYESGSTSTYSMTGSYTGSLNNGTGYSNINGGTWTFDGVDDFINLPINSAFNTPSVTFEVWANLQTINDRHILYLNWSGNALEVNSDRSVAMFNYSSGGQLGATTAANVFNWDNWAHFVGIYDDASQTLKTYVNGILLGTRTSTPSTIYSVGIHKISGTDYGGEVKGKISIVRHYNKALTDAEVSQNFNAQKTRFGL
jgi:hypothetical protein